MNRRTIALFFLVTAVTALLALPAAAWTKKDTCNGHWTRWRLSEETLNVGAGISQFYTSEWRSSIEAAKNGWTLHAPASNFQIRTNWTLDSVTGVSGDTNDDLALASSSSWTYNGLAAVTKHRKSDCDSWNPFDVAHYTEVDVLLNPDSVNWDKSTNPVPNDHMRNTTLILLHEFGHVAGLGDENDVLATMNSGFPGPMGGPIGNNNEVHPLGDEMLGMREAYGDPGDGERDVAASAVYYVSGGVSKTIPAPSSVFRGSYVSFLFTIMNRGRISVGQETIPVHFYLSPTRYAHPSSGLFLGSTTIKLSDGRSTTGSVSLAIPVNAPTGYQYLGWYTDPANGIPETNEGNNGVALVNPTYVSPNRVPIACFTATPSSGYAPLNVSLNASCSSDADGDALTYTWEFPDGSFDHGRTISHTFYAGSHEVILTVTDPSGAWSQTFRNISVACQGGRFCPQEPM